MEINHYYYLIEYHKFTLMKSFKLFLYS